MEIHERIRQIIKETNISIPKFARQAGINYEVLRHQIRSERKISVDTSVKISNTYGINLNWLLTGKGAKRLNRNRYMGKFEEWLDEMEKKDPRTRPHFEMRIEQLFPEFKKWRTEQKEKKSETELFKTKKIPDDEISKEKFEDLLPEFKKWLEEKKKNG
ncbi:MAG: helix-turn-helix transcriptional regulator [Gammaproteobacteria bacterium]|nr:helix-turn-helix transcriptional regulator [Gammaproteobacteria bacterium]